MNKIYSKWLELTERPLKISEQIESYSIVKMLGKGSYGFTYLVEDLNGEQLVLKQLRKYKQLDNHGSLSFHREADILKSLNHKAFPTFINQFHSNGHRFIVMEYKQGFTFEQLIFEKELTFNENEAFYHVGQLLEIVKHIHVHGYVHRDLRIPNILMDNNQYSIIDFGLARKITDKQNTEMAHKNVAKKIFREIAYKSDFYALGHFLLFLLYSSYEPDSKKRRTWEEELTISASGKRILRKMLQLDEPYEEIESLIQDVKECL